MRKQPAINVTLIAEDATQQIIPIPASVARRMTPTDLFDTANFIAEMLEDAPINPRKAQEQEVEAVLRWCL